MTDYSDHDDVKSTLLKDQEAEFDLRQEVAEVIAFQHHPQGQWEPNIRNEFDGRPRYTFDQTKPAVAKVWAEMAANEYTATTQPCGDGADEEVANIIDGLIRNIYNTSSFDDISTKSGKRMIATGFSAWRVVAKLVEDSFYQELKIIPLHGVHERVWFDANSELQTREDAMHVNVLQVMGKSEAEKRWPKRDGAFEDISDSRTDSTYSHKPQNQITVAEILYKKATKKTIYLIDDGDSSVVDDKGLRDKGLTPNHSIVIDQRDTNIFEVFSRKYDGKGWLEPEKKTVFKNLPVIPSYANFDVIENKVTYEGNIRAIMDACRVLNYAESRKVEESILSARAKIWVDDRAASGYASELADLNRDPRAVQIYNGAGADKAAHNFINFSPGPQINPAITEVSDNMIRNIQLSTGLPNELATVQGARDDSDYRFDQRTSQGQLGTFEYYRSHKVALEYTAKTLLGAIPNTYDTPRKIRTVDEAGQTSEVSINDNRNGEMINSLVTGKYDICVNVGPAFESRQQEANTRILELGDRVPGVVERNADIIANNIKAPGMKMVANRERAMLMQQGVIPQDQWTDEETQQMQEAQAASQQQEQQPDPGLLIAQAELQKVQVQAQGEQFKALTEQAKLEQAQSKQNSEDNKQAIELQLKAQKQDIENLKTLVDTLKSYREATGVDAIIGPSAVEGFIDQNELIGEAQSNLGEKL